jgi:O-antigen/teichoic acid export membrane protein
MTRPKHEWSNVFSATVLDAISIGVGICLQIFLMRKLGVSQYGMYAYGCALGFFTAAIADFGSSYAGVRRTVALSNTPSLLRSLFFSVQWSKLLVAGIVIVAAFTFGALMPGRIPMLLPILLGTLGTGLLPAWFVSGRTRVVQVARAWLMARALCAASILLLVSQPEHAALAAALTLSSPLLAALILHRDPEVRRLLSRPWLVPDVGEMSKALRSGSAALPIAIFPSMASAALQTFVLSVSSASVLGLFSAADRVRAAIQGIYLALSSHAFPGSVGSLIENAHGTRRSLTRVALLAILVPGLVAALMAVLAEPIVEVVMGDAYEGAVPVFQVLALAFVPSALALFIVTQVMIPLSMEWHCILAASLGLLLQCVLVAWFVPWQGAVGAALAFAAGEAFVMATLIGMVRRRWRAIN